MPKNMSKFTRLKNMLYDNYNSLEMFQTQLNDISQDFNKWTEDMLNLVHSKNGRKRNIQTINEEKEEMESTNQSSETKHNRKRLRSEKNMSISNSSSIVMKENDQRLKVKDFNMLEIEIKKEKLSIPGDQNNTKTVNEDKENELPTLTTNIRRTRQNTNSKLFNLNNSLLNVVVKQEKDHVNTTTKTKDSGKKILASDNKLIKKLSNSNNIQDEDDVQIQNLKPIENESIKETDNIPKNSTKSIEKNRSINDKSLKKNKQIFDRSVIEENLCNRQSTKEVLNDVILQVNKVLHNEESSIASKCRTPVKESNGKTSYLKNQQLLFNPLDSVKKKIEALEKLNSMELNSTPLKTTRVTRTKTRALLLNGNCKGNFNEKNSSSVTKSNVNNIISFPQEKQAKNTTKVVKKDIKQKNQLKKKSEQKPLQTQCVRGNRDTQEREIVKKTRQIKKVDIKKEESSRKKPQQNEKYGKIEKVKESKSTKAQNVENIVKTVTVLDINTDDETEDETTAKRVIPMWSKSTYRQIELDKQFHIPNNIIGHLFGSKPTCINLKDVFPEINSNRLKRRSSAIWTTPPRYSLMPKY